MDVSSTEPILFCAWVCWGCSAASGGKDLRISPGAGGGGQPTGRLYLGDATPSPGTRSVNVEGDVFNVNTNSMSLQAENTAGSIALGTVSGHSVSISKSGKNTSIQGTVGLSWASHLPAALECSLSLSLCVCFVFVRVLVLWMVSCFLQSVKAKGLGTGF